MVLLALSPRPLSPSALRRRDLPVVLAAFAQRRLEAGTAVVAEPAAVAWAELDLDAVLTVRTFDPPPVVRIAGLPFLVAPGFPIRPDEDALDSDVVGSDPLVRRDPLHLELLDDEQPLALRGDRGEIPTRTASDTCRVGVAP